MIAGLIRQTLKQKRNTIIGFSGVSFLFLLLYVGIFPSFENEQESLRALIKAYPEGLLKAFNLRRELLSTFNLEAFLAMEMFSLMWPIITIAFMLALGGSALAGEIENRTMDLMLAMPVSRIRLFIAKYIATLIAFFIYLVFSFLLVIPLARVFDIDIELSPYLTASIICTAFALAVLGMSLLSSAIFSEKGKSNMVTGGVIALMYVLNLMAGLVDKVNDLKYVSIFHYFDGFEALVDNKIDSQSLTVLLGIAVITTVLAAIVFNRKDIAG